MADIDLKTETPDTTLPTTGFLFGADSQAAASPSVFTVQSVATTLLGSSTLTGSTVTTSSPVIDAAQTWNDGAVTFTGLKFNATDTASASGSLLMDLQVGGVSQFSVGKSGSVAAVTVVANSLRRTSSGGAGITLNENASRLGLHSDTALVGYLDGQRFIFNSATAFGWSPGSANNGAQDLVLTRRGTANLRLGAADAAAPVAQTLSVQSVSAGTSNKAGEPFTITGSQGTGTGAGGSIIFQVAPAGSSGTAQNALATFLEATSARAFNLYNTTDVTTNFERCKIAWESNVLRIGTEKGGTGTARTLELQTDGTTRLSINNVDGNVTLSNGLFVRAFSGNNVISVGPFNTVACGSTSTFSFSSSSAPTGNNSDLFLARDAANTLALRNGTNAQAFRIYNTFTSATNFERGNIFWDSNVLKIGTEKGSGGGTARALELQTDGTTRLTIETGGNCVFSASMFVGSSGLFAWSGRSRISSASSGLLTLYNADSNNFDRLQFGGTTSSFPALKRSTTTLQVRLADDSADAGLQCAALTVTGNLTISTKDIVTDGTTGTKIGTATTQKLGFFNATPVVQPTAVADATDAATVITQLNALLAHMRTLGLIAT